MGHSLANCNKLPKGTPTYGHKTMGKSLVQSHHTLWWSRHHETEYPPAAWGSTVSRWYWGYLPTLMVTKGYILAIIIRYLTDNVHLFKVWICPVRSYFLFFQRLWHCTTVSEPAFTSHGDGGKELRRKHAGPSGLFFFVAALPCFLFKVSKVTKLSSYFDLFLGMVRMVSKSNGPMVPYTYGHCMYRYVDRVRST